MGIVDEGFRRDAGRRLTVAQAADHLGVSVDAVRTRIKRRTIAHEREGGRVYVLLGADESRPGRRPGRGQGASGPEGRTGELIATLREQLQAERQAHAEARRLLAAALERILAIEAPSEADERETPETVEEEPERGQPRPDAAGAHEGVQRPWWRRIFGG